MRRVDHNARDLIRVKRHRDDDVAADTGSLGGVSTGLIDAGRSRVSQSRGGDRGTADNAGTQELTTRELSHESFSSFEPKR